MVYRSLKILKIGLQFTNTYANMKNILKERRKIKMLKIDMTQNIFYNLLSNQKS